MRGGTDFPHPPVGPDHLGEGNGALLLGGFSDGLDFDGPWLELTLPPDVLP